MVDPVAFCSQDGTQKLTRNVLDGVHEGYFAILCGLQYQNSVNPRDLELSNIEWEISVRSQFCHDVVDYIESDSCDISVDCEDYLIFCDFLSCPVVDHSIRWETFNRKLGGQKVSKKEFDELTLHFRHMNWKDKGREFELLIRRLQPVYFSA